MSSSLLAAAGKRKDGGAAVRFSGDEAGRHRVRGTGLSANGRPKPSRLSPCFGVTGVRDLKVETAARSSP